MSWKSVGSTEPLRFLLKNKDVKIWQGFSLSALRNFMKVWIQSSSMIRNAGEEILDPKPSSLWSSKDSYKPNKISY